MASSNVETEIKLYVPDLGAVEAALNAAGAHLKAPRVLERNRRYDSADHALAARGAVLRLRQDSRARLTYKDGQRVTSAHSTSRFEAEIEVSDFDTMEIILNRLGYMQVMNYEKYRTTYALDEVEITLDEMPYGNFIEIEGEDDAIGRMIDRLNLRGAPRFYASYVVMFEQVRQKLQLPFTDLTFENFAGIDVPLSAFESRDG
ncbi:MAG: class IV adenylate cyclase [bacterium]|nr:class IV adenylate cyclase [bacterium]